MLAIALIVFRETLEAALFVGIVAAATRGVAGRGRWLGTGVTAGLAGSLVIAALAGQISELAEGVGQDLVNAGILLVAFLMMAWHIIWSSRHGMEAAGEAKQLGRSLTDGSGTAWALTIAIAMSVLREGAETVLFVSGYLVGNSAQQSGASGALLGSAFGVLSGTALGGLLYLGLSRIPMRRLFAVTNVMILLLAAAMAGQLARALSQAGLLNSFTAPVWNLSEILPNGSTFGALLHALVGYDAQPSGLQVIFYIAGMALIVAGMRMTRPMPVRAASA
jgi:high-affinity iron transporter